MRRILLVWPYHRRDWIQTFVHIDREFELHYLAYIHPSLDPTEVVSRPERVHYWSDYKSAAAILDDVHPDKVVFMSIDSGLGVALNTVAKERNIRTYILQHGIFTNYRDYRIREKLWRKASLSKHVEEKKEAIHFSSRAFIRASIKNPWVLLRLFIHAYFAKRSGPYFANRHFSFAAKKPDFYICYSKANARIYEELDHPREGQLLFTGSPELDIYLQPAEKPPVDGGFMLHIDQAMAENSFGEETVSRTEMISFYERLNVLAKRMGLKLFIKLHPESYQSDWLPKDANMRYLKNTPNLSSYIQHAEICTGFYSTLVIPAAYWNRLILFNIYYSYLQEVLSVIPHVRVTSFRTFDPEKIEIPVLKADGRDLLKSYFLSFDGKSAERIRSILNE